MGNAFGLGQGFDIVESGKKIREIKPMVDTFRALIPSNPIQAAAETNVIGIVVFAIILGSVARLLKQTGTNSMEVFTKLFDELHQLISWVEMCIRDSATPEQNRALRSKASKVDRNAVEVVAPNADRYMDRKEVAVSPVESTTDHLDLVFPEVKSVSPAVEKAINTTIKKYVSKIQNDVEKLNAKESDKTNVVMYYDVKTDKNGIFSVLIHT